MQGWGRHELNEAVCSHAGSRQTGLVPQNVACQACQAYTLTVSLRQDGDASEAHSCIVLCPKTVNVIGAHLPLLPLEKHVASGHRTERRRRCTVWGRAAAAVIDTVDSIRQIRHLGLPRVGCYSGNYSCYI